MLNLEECNVCPRMCKINRYQTTGHCNAGATLKVNLYQPHLGEEPNLTGGKGSGTIFFAYCNTNCVYCQNFSISQFGWGKEISNEELAEIMIKLQTEGACNINLVTPTHFTPQIIAALKSAKLQGLNIPIVWNTNAYERAETLKELDGLVDIYLPDFRYFDSKSAARYSDAENYPDFAKHSIIEMFRQVGHLEERDDIAVRGIMIRILLLPENLNKVHLIMEWIIDNLGKQTYISLMGQYYPTFKSSVYPELNRSISEKEYDFAVNKLNSLGFENGYIQERGSNKDWTPDFFKN